MNFGLLLMKINAREFLTPGHFYATNNCQGQIPWQCYVYFLFQLLSGKHLICLEIFINGLVHDFLWKCPVIVRIGFQPVAGELLVKGWLSMSWLIAICRPESGAVRCEHLITKHNISILIQTKLKLGICNNNTLAQCIFCTLFI